MRINGKNIVREEKGAITAIVLESLLVIVVVFINIYMIGSNKSNSQEKEIKMIQQAYNYTEDKIDSKYKNSIVFEHVNIADTNPKEAMPSNIKEIVENDANKGIVIKDKNENEWVWVEVPRATVFAGLTIDTTTELTEQNYNNIKDKLITYAGVYRNGSDSQNRNDWIDEWYAMDGDTLVTASTSNLTEAQKALTNGCGLTYDEYKTAYQKMLKSVYTYGGFWIGRYEAGIEGTTTETTNARTDSSARISIETSPKAISQKDAIPYNYVYCSEAQALAKEMTPNNSYTSSLMFGIQWDLTCKFLETRGGLKTADINSNSTSWGNYSNVERTISSDKAKKGSIGRYAAVNLCNAHTIEFRMFRGTLKYNTLIATLELVDKICELATNLTDTELKSVSWSDFVGSLDDSTEPELITYLKERQLYINTPITSEEDE